MDIKSRLVLSSQPNKLVLFKEGLFVRFYNQSAYILNQIMGNGFKLQVKQYKKLSGQSVIMGGFLANLVTSCLPNAKATDFGFEVVDEYDLAKYNTWYAHFVAEASGAPIAVSPVIPLGENAATALLDSTVSVSVSVKQLAFLQLWQRGLYSNEVEQNFIASLQQQLQLKP